jgi:multicomponent Na+:H+ antiporter subunit E
MGPHDPTTRAPAGAAPDPSPRREAVRRTLGFAPFLAVFWLVLSGHLEPLMLTLGALSVALVCWLAWRAGLHRHRDLTLSFALRLPLLVLWLGAKVLVSALAVVRKVWSPRPVLHPVVAQTPARELLELSQVVYANAITLTPGTLTLDVGDDRIEVHSLEPTGIDELRGGQMLNQVRRTGGRR